MVGEFGGEWILVHEYMNGQVPFCSPETITTLLIGHVHAKSLQPCAALHSSMPVACQAPLSMGFSRQKYWSGLPCTPPGDLPNPGTESAPPALAGRFFTTSTTWETHKAPVTDPKDMES